MFKCSSVQMFKCSNIQMSKCPNVPMSNVNKVKLLLERTSGVPPVIFLFHVWGVWTLDNHYSNLDLEIYLFGPLVKWPWKANILCESIWWSIVNRSLQAQNPICRGIIWNCLLLVNGRHSNIFIYLRISVIEVPQYFHTICFAFSPVFLLHVQNVWVLEG